MFKSIFVTKWKAVFILWYTTKKRPVEIKCIYVKGRNAIKVVDYDWVIVANEDNKRVQQTSITYELRTKEKEFERYNRNSWKWMTSIPGIVFFCVANQNSQKYRTRNLKCIFSSSKYVAKHEKFNKLLPIYRLVYFCLDCRVYTD